MEKLNNIVIKLIDRTRNGTLEWKHASKHTAMVHIATFGGVPVVVRHVKSWVKDPKYKSSLLIDRSEFIDYVDKDLFDELTSHLNKEAMINIVDNLELKLEQND